MYAHIPWRGIYDSHLNCSCTPFRPGAISRIVCLKIVSDKTTNTSNKARCKSQQDILKTQQKVSFSHPISCRAMT